ncbi:hypothetical protein L226DRAFT_518746 [Lentinus tigrinus ALCF2SS1-7]|uniref:Uncharacterized protein n=1 Tax=Lentinus tigrinus ALCF2SS1-6 TaxID=1328759 RepID=A0A5C2SLI5_9APHY|nr:hypothetical protein L227DRAFT_560467 [Lentinus tigrinus ALCF2SS1-6]RPD82888.1 hypothetical protein L226DRAFT_518746 [Lentinus tigrinus ALCF2SS1-7]
MSGTDKVSRQAQSHGSVPVSRSSSSQSASSQSTTPSPLPGSASIFGIGMLFNGNTEAPDKPRMLYFDANFWGGSSTTSPVSARLRFYNGDNVSFALYSEDPQPYMLFATVAQSQEGVDTCSGGSWIEYDLIGDIHWIVPIPGHHGQVLPMMIVGGPASEIDTKAATFVISANQYTQMLRSIGNVRAKVQISESPRYRNGKPLPFSEGSNASVAGTLAYVSRSAIPGAEDANELKADLFHLNLMNVVYFPRSNAWKPDNVASLSPVKPAGRRGAFAQGAPATPTSSGGAQQSRGGYGATAPFQGQVPIFHGVPQSPTQGLHNSMQPMGASLSGPGMTPPNWGQPTSMHASGSGSNSQKSLNKKRDRDNVDREDQDTNNMISRDDEQAVFGGGSRTVLSGKFAAHTGRGGTGAA